VEVAVVPEEAREKVAVVPEEAAEAGWAEEGSDRTENVFAQSAEPGRPIRGEHPVSSNNVPTAARPWYGLEGAG
jgi:hypothetical protein